MKPILAVTAVLFALAACDVPLAASKECDRHKSVSAEAHADCLAKLQQNEQELRKAD